MCQWSSIASAMKESGSFLFIMAGNHIRIEGFTPKEYKLLVSEFKENNIEHPFQLKNLWGISIYKHPCHPRETKNLLLVVLHLEKNNPKSSDIFNISVICYFFYYDIIYSHFVSIINDSLSVLLKLLGIGYSRSYLKGFALAYNDGNSIGFSFDFITTNI